MRGLPSGEGSPRDAEPPSIKGKENGSDVN